MKRIILTLLVFILIISTLASCNNGTSGDIATTAPETSEPVPNTMKPKAYPNAMQVSAYNLLTDSEKCLYENIARIVSNPNDKKTYTLKKSANSASFDMICDIFKANFGAHNEVIEAIECDMVEEKIISVKLADSFDAEAFSLRYDTLTKEADKIIRSFEKDISYRNLVFDIVDILITETKEDEKADSAYDAIINGKANSRALADAFSLLCKKSGLDCITVFGYEEKSSYDMNTGVFESHYEIVEPRKYWNEVKIWNKWYRLDLSAIREFHTDNFEKFIDLDAVFSHHYSPYYFYRNSFDEMVSNQKTTWKEFSYQFNSANELTELLKASKLYTCQSSNAGGNYYVTFADGADALKATELDMTDIVDCTGEAFTIYLTDYDYDKTIKFITVSKTDEEITAENVDFKNISYNFHNSIGEIYTDNIPCDVEVSLDIPVNWMGEGTGPNYYQYSRIITKQDAPNSSHPHYRSVFHFGLLFKVDPDFKLDADIKSNLNTNHSVKPDDIPKTGVNRYGVEYVSFLKIGDQSLIGTPHGFMYDNIYLRISPEYVLELYFTESENYTGVVWKVIDSVRLSENNQ